jgi:hypothetical protein
MNYEFDEVRDVVLGMVERCAQCGQRHDPENLKMVGKSRTMWAFRLTCTACGAQSFIAAVVGDPGFNGEAISRARGDERRAQRAGAPVTEEDVRAMRNFLEHFNGDFKALFSGGSRRF